MKKIAFVLVVIIFYSCQNNTVKTNFILDDEIESKINSHLKKMTIADKVGQTCQVTLGALMKTDSKNKLIWPHEIDPEKLSVAINDYKIGSILNVSNHTFDLERWHEIIKTVQTEAMSSKLGIPIIYGIDAIHGVTYTRNSTLFPQEIGLAATWDVEHAKVMGEVTAYETRASGIPWNFSPVLDLGRKPIWSRFFETFGEDVYLGKKMGSALVNGYQGSGSRIDSLHVAACLKHYVGYSYPTTGRDRTPCLIPKRTMEEYYLPMFKESIDNGALTVMINSGEVNGIPGHANKYLLTDVLKTQWGFSGFSVSDWEDLIKLHSEHLTDSTLKQAIATAINAGVDMSMVPLSPNYKQYCNLFIELVNEGVISMNRLDDAVRRILRVKYHLNLFEKPYNKLENYNQFASAEFRNKAYKSATESITLLKNNGVLPLSKNKKVLVVGPTSNSLICLNGAWTHTWQGLGSENNKFISNQYNNDFPTILDAVNKKNNGIVHHINGIDFVMKDGDESEKFNSDINFLNIAKSCDYIIVCLGELPSTERPGDLNTLEMTALQKDLVRRLENFNVPKILVLVQGRPKIIRDIEPKFDAVLNAYLPGDQGGVAIADILFGDINPSGKLPYTYPLYPEVILHYDYKQTETINGNTWSNDFYQSQYDFGFGLSYSNFEYSNLKINKKKINEREEIIISVDVENTSDVTGKEVVQLYTRDHYATIAPPLKKLQRFTKIELSAKEKKTVNFTLSEKDLRFFGIENKWISENGKFSIFINQLEEEFTLIKS